MKSCGVERIGRHKICWASSEAKKHGFSSKFSLLAIPGCYLDRFRVNSSGSMNIDAKSIKINPRYLYPMPNLSQIQWKSIPIVCQIMKINRNLSYVNENRCKIYAKSWKSKSKSIPTQGKSTPDLCQNKSKQHHWKSMSNPWNRWQIHWSHCNSTASIANPCTNYWNRCNFHAKSLKSVQNTINQSSTARGHGTRDDDRI